jgi:hypothetical protein
MSKQVLLKGAAGTLYFWVEEGRPSAVTVTLRTSANAQLATPVEASSILASLGSVNTTCSGTAGTITLTVASATGITVDAEYLVASLAARERVRVRSISGTTLTLYAPLRRTRSSATFCDVTVSVSVIAGNNDAVDLNRRVRLVYTVSSQSFIRDYLYDVREHKWLPTLSTDGLLEYAPDLEGSNWAEQGNLLGFQPQIDRAEERLRSDLLRRGRDIDDLMHPELAEEAHARAALYLIYREWAVRDEGIRDARDHELEQYLVAVEGLAGGVGIWWDADHDLSADTDDVRAAGPIYSWRT